MLGHCGNFKMAADVRDADSVLEDAAVDCSLSIPTHVIVQNQLKDVIRAQSEMVARLSQNVSQQESFIKEAMIPKEEHEAKLENLQMSMLEDLVPRDDYEKVQSQLENEQLEHAQTKGKLMEVTDKLEFALGQIEVLTKQLEREKTAFENAFGSLKSKAIKESSKNQELETKCNDIHKKYVQKEGALSQKQKEVQMLEQRLREQEQQNKFKVTELEVERQQEKYILSLMSKEKGKENKTGAKKRF